MSGNTACSAMTWTRGSGSKISDIVVNDTRFRAGTRFASFNGAVYLAADDGANGEELWKTDGTAGGTQLTTDPELGQRRLGFRESLPSSMASCTSAQRTPHSATRFARPTARRRPACWRILNPGVNGSSFNGPAACSANPCSSKRTERTSGSTPFSATGPR